MRRTRPQAAARAGEFRVEEVDQRLGHELGDPAAAVGYLFRASEGGGELLAQLDDFFPGHAAAAGHDVVERLADDVLHGE